MTKITPWAVTCRLVTKSLRNRGGLAVIDVFCYTSKGVTVRTMPPLHVSEAPDVQAKPGRLGSIRFLLGPAGLGSIGLGSFVFVLAFLFTMRVLVVALAIVILLVIALALFGSLTAATGSDAAATRSNPLLQSFKL
jgi:hypothetical protein